MEAATLEATEVMVRLAVAAGLSGVLGLEREYDGQDAGFRTHLLLALGSALFALLSVGGFGDFVAARADTNVTVDVTRLAAYVAPGIGFIGGGAILKYGGRVTGITTAASLWTAAAIGVAAGLGAHTAAVVTSVVALLALEGLQPVSRLVGRLSDRRRADLMIELAPGADAGPVLAEVTDQPGWEVRSLQYGAGPDDEGHISLRFLRPPPSKLLADVVGRLAQLDGVHEVRSR